MNPFNQETKKLEDYFMNWEQMYPKSYDKNKVLNMIMIIAILVGK